jgi:hypothetical protein
MYDLHYTGMECNNNCYHWRAMDIVTKKDNDSNNAAHSQEQSKWVALNKIAKASKQSAKAEFEQIAKKRWHRAVKIDGIKTLTA